MSDPRVGGTYRYTQNAHDHGGMGPNWGTMRVENDDGAWEGPVSGYWYGSNTYMSGCLKGEDAYEGLSYCLRGSTDGGPNFIEFDGLIYQGDPPPLQ